MRHVVTAALLVGVLSAATAGCAGDGSTDTTSPVESSSAASPAASASAPSTAEKSESPSPEPEPAANRIEMTLKNGKVSPAGDRVNVAAGEPITFAIDADAPGELHVHSAAAPVVAFEAGISEHKVTVDQPGIVEVELHDPALVVVQLEVR